MKISENRKKWDVSTGYLTAWWIRSAYDETDIGIYFIDTEVGFVRSTGETSIAYSTSIFDTFDQIGISPYFMI